MKLIVAGSRHFIDFTATFLDDVIWTAGIHQQITEIVSGGAEGIDKLGETWTGYMDRNSARRVILRRFPADWDKHGKAAGPIRNKQMAEYADTLLLIWDGKSRGSANMRAEMLKLGKPVYEVILKVTNEPSKEK